MTIYRFVFNTPSDAMLAAYVPGSPTVNARGADIFVDVSAPGASLTDLQEYMTASGWSYVGASPATTPEQETATDLPAFGSATKGVVPASGGGTANFLRADGTWATPAGTGVTSVSGTAPIVSSGGVTPAISITSFAGSSAGAVPTSLGGTANFLRADGAWAAPSASSFSATSTDVTFAAPLNCAYFDVAHVGAVTTNKVVASVSATMPSGVDADELEMDPLTVFGSVPTNGTVRLYVAAASQQGMICGSRRVNYALG